MKDEHNISQTIAEFGLALIITAIPIGMFAKIFLGQMQLGNITMAIGFCFLFPYKNFFISGHSHWTKLNRNILMFFFLSFTYFFMTGYNDNMHLVYMAVPVFLCIALSYTNYEEDLIIEHVIYFTWILSFLCVVCSLYIYRSGIYNDLVIEYNSDSNNQMLFDALTVGYISIINICSSLCLLLKKYKARPIQILYFLSIILSLYVIVLTFKRTPLLISFFSIFFFLWKCWDSISSKYKLLSFILLILFIFLVNVGEFKIKESLYNTTTGLIDLIFGTNSYDSTNSASIRYYARKDAFDQISEFSTMEMIFGAGYMKNWCDIPLLQAYIDMGILGFVLWSLNIVWLPIKTIIKCNKDSLDTIWAVSITLYALFSCVSSGHPYMHIKWIPIVILVFILNGKESQINKE